MDSVAYAFTIASGAVAVKCQCPDATLGASRPVLVSTLTICSSPRCASLCVAIADLLRFLGFYRLPKGTHRAERTPATTALQRGPVTPGPGVGAVNAVPINDQRRTAQIPRSLQSETPRRAGHGSQLRSGWPGEWSATRTADKPSQSSPPEPPTT